MKELTFLLGKGEKVLKDAAVVFYSGVGYVSIGSGFGAIGESGLGGGIFSSKQVKREGSVFDAKPAHAYLTNKRIVFCNAKIGLFGGSEKEIGSPFAEIQFKLIRGINKSIKLGCAAMDISLANSGGSIDNIKVWFAGATGGREGERDQFLAAIKKQLK